ncbi:MAG: hypothetical protein U0074_08880 [Kouleothrix sp.]
MIPLDTATQSLRALGLQHRDWAAILLFAAPDGGAIASKIKIEIALLMLPAMCWCVSMTT